MGPQFREDVARILASTQVAEFLRILAVILGGICLGLARHLYKGKGEKEMSISNFTQEQLDRLNELANTPERVSRRQSDSAWAQGGSDAAHRQSLPMPDFATRPAAYCEGWGDWLTVEREAARGC